jgi:hypothetical protein
VTNAKNNPHVMPVSELLFDQPKQMPVSRSHDHLGHLAMSRGIADVDAQRL